METLPLSKRLYEKTKSVHEQVESMPFILALREQKIKPDEYCQYLADLKVVYETLENAMRANLNHPFIHIMYDEKLCRKDKLEADLTSFQAEKKTPTQAALEYVNHLKELSSKSPFLLLAHAYVRYMGDLSGGRMIKKFIDQLFEGNHTAFYNFDELLGVDAQGAKHVDYKNAWKKRLDNLSFSEADQQALIDEAKKSFEYAGLMFKSYVIPKTTEKSDFRLR